MNKRCLILGGCGFIGSHIAELLIENGYAVRIFDRKGGSRRNIEPFKKDIELFEGDFNHIAEFETLFHDVEFVIHLVSTTVVQSSHEDPIYDLQSNVISTLHLLERISKIKTIKKIVFASSGGTIYGIPDYTPICENHPTFPICPYGISKLAIEKYLHYYQHTLDLNYISLRISNPYGERQNIYGTQGAIAVFLGKILHHEKITIWGDGEIQRDYVYIKDVAQAFLMALENQKTGVYNVASGKGRTLNEIIRTLESITKTTANVSYEAKRPVDIPINVLNIEKIKQDFGWFPDTFLEEGIERTWESLKDNYRSSL